jgi:hypothetical protein
MNYRIYILANKVAKCQNPSQWKMIKPVFKWMKIQDNTSLSFYSVLYMQIIRFYSILYMEIIFIVY